MDGKSGINTSYKKRPPSNRARMPASQRAKQFAPFDALTGLSERLRQAEEEHRLETEAKGAVHVDLSEAEMNEGQESEEIW